MLLNLVRATLLLVLASTSQALDINDPAPAVIDSRTPTVDQLQALRGQVVFVDFWASWCGPCKKSLPALNNLYQRYHAQGFTVLAVNLDETEQARDDFLARYPVSYPVVSDPAAVNAKTYNLLGMPSLYVVDKSGKLRGIHQGFKTSDEARLEQALQALLAETVAP